MKEKIFHGMENHRAAIPRPEGAAFRRKGR